MTNVKAKRKREKTYTKFAEADQIKVVQEIAAKLITPSAAIRKYGFSQRTIYNWINKYSLCSLTRENHKSSIPIMQETNATRLLIRKVKELERALLTANLKVEALETTIEVAESHLKIKIRKKAGSKQSGK